MWPVGEVVVSHRSGRLLASRWKDIALIAILLLLPLACFADVILLSKTFYFVDIELAQVPGRTFVAQMFKAGQISFWNPDLFMGFPLQAEPEVGPLYPLNLIFALPIPAHLALTLFLLAHYGLAGAFTYILSRSLRISRSGSFISGLVFAYGGALVAQLTNMNIATAIVWLPLILCLFMQAMRKCSFAWAAAAGIALALMILTAHPQIILYVLLILGFYYVYSLLLRLHEDARTTLRGRGILRLSLVALTTVAVGLGLAAIQLVPTYQLKQLSLLSEDSGYEFVTAYSLPKFRLLTFIFPNFLGNPITGYRGGPIFEEHHGYAGILPLILAALAWGKRKNPQVLFFGLLAIFATLLALGSETPLYRLLAYVPVYNWFRIPSRWLLVLTFSLGVLAGFGFDFLLAQRGKRPLPRWAKGLIVAAIVLTVTLPLLFLFEKQAISAARNIVQNVYAGQATRTLRALVRGLPQFPDAEQTNLLAQLFRPLLNPILFFLFLFNVSVTSIMLFLREKISMRLFQLLAVGLVIFDLFLAGGTAIVRVRDASYFDTRASTDFVKENVGLYRIYSPDPHGEAPQKLLDYYPTMYRIQSLGTLPSVSVLTLSRYAEFVDALLQNTRLFNLAGVKYILTELEEPAEWWHNELREVWSEPGLRIYENLDVMPRAFLVHQAQVPGSDEAMLALLAGEEFDLSTSILLEDENALRRLESMTGGSGSVEGGDRVNIVEYEPARVVIDTESDQAGFLFLSDMLYPGWRAHVDGQEEAIYRADYAFRAVLVPAGRHTVSFSFDPVAFKIGLALALLTASLLALAAILTLKRSRS